MLPLADGTVCVIDWENCGLADPAHELPMALLDFCFGDQGRAVALYAAYRENGGPARLRHRGDFTMVIAQFGHFWEMAIESYLAADATADDKSHSIERIAELTSMPLRLEHIDSMLDWTAGIH